MENDLEKFLSRVKEGLNQLQYDVNEILQSNALKNFHFLAKFHSNFSMSDPAIIIQNLLQIFIDIVDLKLIEDILENKPFFIFEVLKLASFLFHENFLSCYWEFTYKCAVNTPSESSKSLFYDRLKWIYYAHKQLTNEYYFISNSPKFKQIVLSSLSKVQTDTGESGDKEENSEDEIEKEDISVFSYEIFVYHCLNSFLVASKEFLAMQQDIPSTSCLLPRQVVSWFSFFDDSLLRKFLTFFLFHQEASMNEAVNSRMNQGFTEDDRSFLFQQFLLCIEDSSLLLRFLTISCQIFQYRKKKWTDEQMVNSEESRVGGFLISIITRYLTVIPVVTSKNDETDKQSNENYLMHQLINRIFLKFDFSSSFIQRLFPPNPSLVSSIPSSAFVTVFSKHQLLMLLCKLIDSWGSPYFQNNAMLSRYESLSVFILTILTSGAVVRSDLASPIFLVKEPQRAPNNESHMISVESLLVEAISKGLESSFPLVRFYTMKIAQEYARLMEYSLEFDELKELEKQNKIQQQPTIVKEEADNDSEEEEEEENDEDEIQGYYISKEQDSIVNDLYLPPPTTSSADGSLPKRKKIYYLRECLELLKAPEGSPDIRAGTILALENLPTILQNHPYDGQNFAHPLLFQLLNLSNQYNIEEFDRLKSEAVISVVKEYPLQTLPLLNQSILNRDLPLALRIHSIQYHRIVATFFYDQNMKTVAEQNQKLDPKSSNINNSDKQKTVIKRPRRYELLRKKYEQQRQEKQLGYSTIKKNVFQEYSELFISPVLQLLQQFHEHYSKGKNTSTSVTSTETKSFLANPIEVEKDRFNLIAEAFPDDKLSSNRSKLLKDETFELTTLRLPSSTTSTKKKSDSVKPLIQEINNDVDMKVTSKVENKPKKTLKSSSNSPPKLPDEMDTLLPYDALLSLAIYMRYSTFQNQYRLLAFVCVELSITYFKTFTMSLGLRRASLCLLVTVIEGLLNSYDTTRSSGPSSEERLKIAGVLDSLLKITALHSMEEEKHLTQTANSSSGGLEAIKEELLSRTSVLELIEILLERMEQQKESDLLCQQLTVSLIKIFQEQLFSQAF